MGSPEGDPGCPWGHPEGALGPPKEPLRLPWGPKGSPKGDPGCPWGHPEGALDPPRASLWLPLAPFGLQVPWVDPGGALGDLVDAEPPCQCIESAFSEHATGATGATGDAGDAEVVSRTVTQTPPPTHAGGQDDGSYTNSLKLNYITCSDKGDRKVRQRT